VAVWLKVEARPGQSAPTDMRPMPEQIARLWQLVPPADGGGVGICLPGRGHF
jgi:hypothetical protein